MTQGYDLNERMNGGEGFYVALQHHGSVWWCCAKVASLQMYGVLETTEPREQ